MATGPFRCSVPSCFHDAISDSGDVMCPEHWECVPTYVRTRLLEAKGTQGWLRLARIATEAVEKEFQRREFLGKPPFHEAAGALA